MPNNSIEMKPVSKIRQAAMLIPIGLGIIAGTYLAPKLEETRRRQRQQAYWPIQGVQSVIEQAKWNMEVADIPLSHAIAGAALDTIEDIYEGTSYPISIPYESDPNAKSEIITICEINNREARTTTRAYSYGEQIQQPIEYFSTDTWDGLFISGMRMYNINVELLNELLGNVIEQPEIEFDDTIKDTLISLFSDLTFSEKNGLIYKSRGFTFSGNIGNNRNIIFKVEEIQYMDYSSEEIPEPNFRIAIIDPTTGSEIETIEDRNITQEQVNIVFDRLEKNGIKLHIFPEE